MKEIIYIATYGDKCNDDSKERLSHPASDIQVYSLSRILSEAGFKVSILSSSIVDTNKFVQIRGSEIKNDPIGITIKWYFSIGSKYKPIRALFRYFTYIFLLFDLLKRKDKQILIYHSYSYYFIYRILRLFKIKYTLELEEIYSDFMNLSKNKELNYIDKASKYILSTLLLSNYIDKNKKRMLYHGNCFAECENKEKFRYLDGKIHLVYAGTLDTRKVGSLVAIDVGKYLSNNYRIHILGIGTDKEIEDIKNKIGRLNALCKITYDGILLGDEYTDFIKKCDIGLYTQDSKDVPTNFPSKLMSYLTCGLRIVANKTVTLENSEIRDLIVFSPDNNPEKLANVVVKINLNDKYDYNFKLDEIKNRIKKDLVELFEED